MNFCFILMLVNDAKLILNNMTSVLYTFKSNTVDEC